MRMGLILVLLCLCSSSGFVLAADSPINDEISKLQKQINELQKELSELKSLIKTMPDGRLFISSAKDMRLDTGKSTLITAKDKLILQVGKASIVLSKNGDIVIDGREIDIKAASDLRLKGSKVQDN